MFYCKNTSQHVHKYLNILKNNQSFQCRKFFLCLTLLKVQSKRTAEKKMKRGKFISVGNWVITNSWSTVLNPTACLPLSLFFCFSSAINLFCYFSYMITNKELLKSEHFALKYGILELLKATRVAGRPSNFSCVVRQFLFTTCC